MAEEVGNLKVKLGMDDAEFKKSISSLGRNMRAVTNELKGLKNKGDEWGNSLTGLKAKQETLNRALSTQKQQVQALESAYNKSVAGKGKDAKATEELYIKLKRAESEYNRFETELNQVTSAMNKQQAEAAKSASVFGRLSSTVSKAGSTMKNAGTAMKNVGTTMAQSFGVATLAVGAAFGSSVKKAADFEAQMSKVGAIAGASGKDIDKLKASALDLGAKTSLSASQVAEAMKEMAAKGYSTNQIIASMPGVISAAEASGEDLAMVADTVSSAINSFGLSAKDATHVADVLAKAANDSAAGIEDMQYAFKYAAPVGKMLGISMEQLSASVELMSNNGIKGEQAGTSLRAALLRLANPTKEASATLKDLGVKITDSNGKMLPFSKIIGQLKNSTDGMTNAQKSAALSTIFGTEAVSGMLAVVNAGPEKLDKLTKSLENSDGASAKAAAQMKDNLKGALQELQGSFETAQITIGTALIPAIEKIATVLKSVTDKFNSLSPSMQQFIAIGGAISVVVLAIVTAIAGLVAIIGGAISGFGAIATAVGGVMTSIAEAGGIMAMFSGAVSSALAVITGPIGIAVAAIALLTGAITALWMNHEGFRNAITTAWIAIQSAISSAITGVMTFLQSWGAQLSSFWSTNQGNLATIASTVWGGISAVISGALTVISGIMRVVWPIIQALVVSTWNAIVNVIQGVTKVITGIIQTFSALLTGDWKKAWEGVKQVLSGVLQAIWGAINLYFVGKLLGPLKAFGPAAKGIVQVAWNGIKAITTSLLSGIKNVVVNSFNLIRNSISSVMSATNKVVTSGWSGIKSVTSSLVSGIKNTVVNIFNSLKGAISTAMSGVKNAVVTGWNNAVSFLKGINLVTIGKNIIQGLINGIGSMMGAVTEKVKSIASSVTNTIKKALDIHSPSRETYKLGGYTGQGFANGIGSKKKEAEKQARALATAAKKAFSEKVQKLDLQLKAGTISTGSYVKAMTKLKNDYKYVTNATQKIDAKIAAANTKKAKEEQKKRQQAAAKLQKEFNTKMQNFDLRLKAGKIDTVDYEKSLNKMKDKYETVPNAIAKIDAKIATQRSKTVAAQFKKDKSDYVAKKKDADASMQDELNTLNELSKHYKKNSDERIYFENLAKQKKQEITEAKKKIDEDYLSKVEELNTKLAESEQKLTDEYKKAVDDKAKSLYNFAGLFDEVTLNSEISGQKLLENLQGQVTTFEQWQKSISDLSTRGIVSDDLIKELQEMGPKSAAEIAALNTLTDEQLTQYQGLWQTKSKQAHDEAVSELEGMRIDNANQIAKLREDTQTQLETYRTEWETKMKSVIGSAKNMSKQMPSIGANAVQGLIDGINSKKTELQAVAAELAAIVASTTQSELDIHSPSRVMKKLGEYTNEGFIVGLQDSFTRLKSAMSNMYGSLANSAQTMMNVGSSTVNSSSNSYDYSKNPSYTVHVNAVSDTQIARVVRREFEAMAFKG